MNVHWDGEFYDVLSFFDKAIHRVRVFGSILSSFTLSVPSLVQTGASPILDNMDFLSPAWQKSMETIESPLLRTANCKVEFVKRIVPLFV